MIKHLINRRPKVETPPDKPEDSRSINLERVGRTRIDDLVASTRKVPWIFTLLQLLWTAGPVTYLAMQGGHYLGYGEPVSVATYIFFAIYVVLAALIGIVARIVADIIRGKRQSQARANITRTLDVAPDLIFTVRDLHLANLSPEERQRESAAILLTKLDTGPISIAMAVEDLTGDSVLADIAKRIEIHRRAGMFSCVRDWANFSADRREAALSQFREQSPEICRTLEQRLLGFAPSQEAGTPRGRNFIGQIFAAAHHDDLSLMSLTDVEDLLVLTFELLSGRQITRLTIDYEGDWELAKALDEVEQSQIDYRQVKAASHLHLHNLASCLVESGLTSLDHGMLELNAGQRLEQTRSALSVLVARLHKGATRLPRDPAATDNMRRALRYAKLSRHAIERLNDRYRRNLRALDAWEKLRRKHLDRAGTDAQSPPRRQGLRIKESMIALEDEQKLELAAAFCRYLDDMRIRPGNHGVLRRNDIFKVEDAKRLGIQLTLMLRPLVDLDNPSVQRAIESSNAIFLGGLEIGFSADARAGLGAAAVKEVQERLGAAAELIALRLARLYRLPLTPSIVDFLSDTYGANRQYLEYLSESAEDAERADESAPNPAALTLSQPYDQWREPIQAVEKLLARLVR
jgi:hypothetical protein